MKDKKLLIIGKKDFMKEYKVMLEQSDFSVDHAFDEQKIKEKINKTRLIIFEEALGVRKRQLKEKVIKLSKSLDKQYVIVSSSRNHSAVLKAEDSHAADYIVAPFNYREFVSRINAVIRRKKRISCLGGGTGLFGVLMGLKNLPHIHLTSIVSMSDDGGSSGKLRASFGILPPGDIRRSLVALSNAPTFMNEVMQYRFKKGDGLSGHSLGNLFLTAIADLKGSMSESVRILGDILNIQGIVLPVTNKQTTLCAFFENGAIVKGEHKIDLAEERSPQLHIQKIWHEPEPKIDTDAYSSLINSDVIILGPGDLFTSVVTNLVVKGVVDAIRESKAKKVYVCNLMTKPGETTGFGVFEHVREVVKYLGGDFLDYIIVSNTKLSPKSVRAYKKKGQDPVKLGNLKEIAQLTKANIVIADVGDSQELVRHNSVKMRQELAKIIKRTPVK